nr:hypothetical protein [Ruegeria arenilitoris]
MPNGRAELFLDQSLTYHAEIQILSWEYQVLNLENPARVATVCPSLDHQFAQSGCGDIRSATVGDDV